MQNGVCVRKGMDMKPVSMIVTLVAAVALGACAHDSFLEQRTNPDRAAYGDQVIPVPPPHVEAVNPNPLNANTMIVTEHIAGTWKFTVPNTVTQMEKKTVDYDQFSLYEGRPAPTDVPFLVITTTRERASIAQADPGMYKLSGQREYVMNGGVVQEWTGLTSTGAGFCEMVVRKPGAEGQSGDVCHAMAVVKTEDQRKLALGILETVVWQPNR
jgi:hypothetical protein